MGKRHFLLCTLLIAAHQVSAQRTAPGKDTVLKASTIEVLQSYKPQIKQAPKPEWIPQLPPVDTTHPTFKYDVPQQTLYYTYSSLPLRPLALGKESVKLPFENYVKLGGGNLSTIYLDAGIGGIHGKGYETNIHLHHLSQKGDIGFQESSQSGIEAEGIFHGKKAEWHATVNGELNRYYDYGYDHNLFPYNNADSLKQAYTTIGAGLEMKNVVTAKTKFSYNPSVSATMYTAEQSTSEPNVMVSLPFEYRFDETVQALLAVNGDYAHLTTKDSSRDNTLAGVSPGIRIHSGVFTGHARIGFAFGSDDRQYILPDIQAAVGIHDNTVIISAGWEASVRQNTYQQLSSENPYMFNAYTQMQTLRNELYGQLQGKVGAHFVYAGRVSLWSFKGLPEFINPIGDQKQFYVIYDTANAVSFQLSARYKVATKWSAGINCDIYAYNGSKQQYVWHRPGTKIKGDFEVTIIPKLTAGAYMSVIGGIHAIDITGKAVTLDPGIDVGGNMEYQIVKRLSVFVQINNILNNTYQRWYGYDAYGLNIYGGLRLKF